MFINFSKRYIFVAVPRTGSTGIHRIILALSRKNDEKFYFNNSSLEITESSSLSTDKDFKHLTYNQILSNFEDVSDYTMFHFVRNPYDRTASDFFLRRRIAQKIPKKFYKSDIDWRKKIIKFREDHSGLSIEESFSKHFNEMYPPELRHSAYKEYSGSCKNKIVCRFEDFEIELKKALHSIGYDTTNIKVPVINSNKINRYDHVWNKEFRSRLYASFYRDFVDYGYEECL